MPSSLAASLRTGAVAERLRESLAAPAVVGLVIGIALGAVLGRVEGPALVNADLDRQFTVMTTLLSAIMTVVGVVLSVLVVAQQLAGQQYSPRAIRTTMRDRPTRIAIGGLFAYVAFMVGVILVIGPTLRTPVGIPVGMALSVGALGLVAYLIQHVTDGFRSATLVNRIGEDTIEAVLRIAARDDDAEQRAARVHGLEDVPEDALPVDAPASGYLQEADVDAMARQLHDLGAVVRLSTYLGDFIGEGTGVGWAWASTGTPADLDRAAVQEAVQRNLRFGSSRTTEREMGSGVQQLIDIALKALSPGVNDPHTTVQAVNILTRVTQELAGRRQDWVVGVVEDDLVVTIPRPLLWDVVAQAVNEVRPVAHGSPPVLAALAMMLRTVASSRPAEADKAVFHLDAIAAELERSDLLEVDRERVTRQLEAARRECRRHQPEPPAEEEDASEPDG